VHKELLFWWTLFDLQFLFFYILTYIYFTSWPYFKKHDLFFLDFHSPTNWETNIEVKVLKCCSADISHNICGVWPDRWSSIGLSDVSWIIHTNTYGVPISCIRYELKGMVETPTLQGETPCMTWSESIDWTLVVAATRYTLLINRTPLTSQEPMYQERLATTNPKHPIKPSAGVNGRPPPLVSFSPPHRRESTLLGRRRWVRLWDHLRQPNCISACITQIRVLSYLMANG